MSSVATMAFAARELRSLVPGRSVVEIGAGGCRRGLRDLLAPYGPGSYVGVDIIDGPRVDLIVDLTSKPSTIPAADIVVCMEVLEHVKDWRRAVDALKELTKPGGWILITTRSPGYRRHLFPMDHWRYTGRDIATIFGDFDTVALEPDPFEAGIFYVGRKNGGGRVDLSQIELEPAPAEFSPRPEWARKTRRYLVSATLLALRSLTPTEAFSIFRIDYPTRLLRLAGIWEWPN